VETTRQRVATILAEAEYAPEGDRPDLTVWGVLNAVTYVADHKALVRDTYKDGEAAAQCWDLVAQVTPPDSALHERCGPARGVCRRRAATLTHMVYPLCARARLACRFARLRRRRAGPPPFCVPRPG
jgi:hypothetical protein